MHLLTLIDILRLIILAVVTAIITKTICKLALGYDDYIIKFSCSDII